MTYTKSEHIVLQFHPTTNQINPHFSVLIANWNNDVYTDDRGTFTNACIALKETEYNNRKRNKGDQH
jgi:hypothetical protein